jgi:hypothetical protein
MMNSIQNFNWSDHALSCELYKKLISHDESHAQSYLLLKAKLDELKRIPLWIKTKMEVMSIDLYELYASHVRGSFENVHQLSQVSFVSPSGPYKLVSVSSLLALDVYENFVKFFLLTGQLKPRDFRLRIRSKILMEFGQNSSQVGLLELQQITPQGILLKCHHRDEELLMSSQSLSLFVNPSFMQNPYENLEQMIVKNSNPFYTQDRSFQLAIKLNSVKFSKRFDFNKTQESFLYVSYDQLEDQNKKIIPLMKTYVKKSRDSIERDLFKKAS